MDGIKNIIFDDELYFLFLNNKIGSNKGFYATEKKNANPNTRLKLPKKFR